MKGSEKDHLHKRRFLMGNPTAHIEQLVDMGSERLATPEEVSAGRFLLQNPYAYLDEDGALKALETSPRAHNQHDLKAIARAVRNTHIQLWKSRNKLWQGNPPQSPVDLLNPLKAAELFGFTASEHDSLGFYVDRFEKVGVAGILDRGKREIRISRDFAIPERRFTAAHEIGHLVLHPNISILHRDRAVTGSKIVRDRVEFEADKFAVYFLLPAKLIRAEFEERFLTQRFELNADTEFALGKRNLKNLKRSKRTLCRDLAQSIQFNGKFFISLAERFGVTVETMAIRLEELRIVK